MNPFELEYRRCAHIYCNQEFPLTRSNKRFCSGGCRSASHQLKQRKREFLAATEPPNKPPEKSLGNIFQNQKSTTVSIAESAVGNLAVEAGVGLLKRSGVVKSAEMKMLEEVKQEQKIILEAVKKNRLKLDQLSEQKEDIGTKFM